MMMPIYNVSDGIIAAEKWEGVRSDRFHTLRLQGPGKERCIFQPITADWHLSPHELEECTQSNSSRKIGDRF